MKYYCLIILLCCASMKLFGQHIYGTTGLLHAPTAEMQKEKTFMIGGSMIDHNIYRSNYWKRSREYTPYTYNYYLNITIFPWLEVAYTCTLVKGGHGSSYWPQQTCGKSRIRSVPFTSACVHGRRAGGSHGHRKSC